MRIFTYLAKVILFLLAFLAASWFFMPWKQVGEYVFSAASTSLSNKKMEMAYSSVEEDGAGFSVKDLHMKGFASLSVKSLSFRPNLIASVLNMAPVCDMDFSGGELQIMQRQPARLGDGQVTVIARPNEVFLEQLRTDGDLAISGFLGFEPATFIITRAEASVKVAELLEPEVEAMSKIAPLTKEAPGRWLLRRQAGAGVKQ